VPDPHYGLPVVVCPSCGAPCVRVRHPDAEFFRWLRALRRGLGHLLALALMLALLAVILDAAASFAAHRGVAEIVSVRHGHDVLIGRVSGLLVVIVFAAVIRVMLAHRSALGVAAMIGVIAAAPRALMMLLYGLGAWMESLIGGDNPWDFFANTPYSSTLLGLLLAMIPIGFGVLIGQLVLPHVRRAMRRYAGRRHRKVYTRRARAA